MTEPSRCTCEKPTWDEPEVGLCNYCEDVQRAERLAAQPVEAGEDAAQRLQDHMEQHHGVCLSASDWDAAVAAALGTRP